MPYNGVSLASKSLEGWPSPSLELSSSPSDLFQLCGARITTFCFVFLLSMAPTRRRHAQPVLGYGTSHCTTQFIDHFAKKAAQKQRQPRRAQLTVQRHAAFRQRVGMYASSGRHGPTTPSLTLLESCGSGKRTSMAFHPSVPMPKFPLTNTVNKYYEHMELGEWRSALQAADTAVAMDFLLHLPETRRTRRGVPAGTISGNTNSVSPRAHLNRS